MAFHGLRKTLTFTQTNNGRPGDILPLLCPVREKDWLEDWNYDMIYSQSGLVEQGCIFTTPHHGDAVTTWYVDRHSKPGNTIGFIRITPGETVVRITIRLEESGSKETRSHITYEYTGLSDKGNDYIAGDLEVDFKASMGRWEKAINHYLETGQMLKST